MNPSERLHQSLSGPLREAVDAAIEVASALGLNLFVAAGALRDALIGLPARDVDLVVEGDPALLVGRLAERLGVRVTTHNRFGTATLKGGSFTLDIARSRSETYAHPGALPVVAPATIEEDLRRRDFTINAMALRLTDAGGEILDPLGGRKDLADRLVRILHPRSFQDDPTRIFRALRDGARLAFSVEPGTDAAISRGLDFIAALSAARVRRELTLGLDETNHIDFFSLAEERGVLAAVDPCLALPPALARSWREAEGGPHWGSLPLLGWCLLLACPDAGALTRLDRRLALSSRVLRVLSDFVLLCDHFAKLGPAAADVDLLAGVAPEAVWAFSIRYGAEAGAACADYLERSRRAEPGLTGHDLLAAGVPAGPEFGRLLRLLRRERLAGRVKGREQEMAVLQGELEGTTGSTDEG